MELKVPFFFIDQKKIDQKKEIGDKVLEIMNSIDYSNTNPDYYKSIINSILTCRNELERVLEVHQPMWYYQEQVEQIYNHLRKNEIIPSTVAIPIVFTGEEIVNGYKLYPYNSNVFNYFSYVDLKKLAQDPKVYSKEEFFAHLEEICCTDWAKMDRHGESFGGEFWKTHHENAWSLTQQDNFQGLFELPFSHELIFKTIDIGCGNRRESVRYTNFVCHWVECKMKQEEESLSSTLL